MYHTGSIELAKNKLIIKFIEGEKKMEEKTQMVLEEMKKAGKPLRPGDIAKITGLEKNEVSKIISALKKSGQINSPKRCFYAPAE